MEGIVIPACYVEAVLRHAPGREALLDQAGIPSPPPAVVSAQAYARLVAETIKRLGDETLGYGQRPTRPGTWFMMCHAIIQCETLGQALRRMCRFYGLFDSGLLPHLRIEGDEAFLELVPSDRDFPFEFFAYELSCFVFHRLMSWLIRQHLPLEAVAFPGSMPDHASALRRTFLANPILYGQERPGLRFHRQFLDRRIAQNVQTLARFLRSGYYEMLAAQYPHVSWTARLRAILTKDLSSIPAFEDLAGQLDIHPQTLRRRLAEEGTTYKQLKSHIRRDMALHYLEMRDWSVEEIAARAGFSEASAFIRAFRSWTGMTPHAYRGGDRRR